MTPRSPFSSGSFRAIFVAASRMTLKVPVRLTSTHRWKRVEREGPSSSFQDHARRRADACAVHGAVERVEGVDEALNALLVVHVVSGGPPRPMTARLLEQAAVCFAEA